MCSDDFYHYNCSMPHQVCDAASLVCKCVDGFAEDKGACSPILGNFQDILVFLHAFTGMKEIWYPISKGFSLKSFGCRKQRHVSSYLIF